MLENCSDIKQRRKSPMGKLIENKSSIEIFISKSRDRLPDHDGIGFFKPGDRALP
jgi:hypothetical protein